MAIHKLTAAKAEKAGVPKGQRKKLHGDGGGLYLQCTRGARGNITRSWLGRYRFMGKPIYVGLGPLDLVDPAEAREANIANRKLIRRGLDPREEREAEIAKARAERAKRIRSADAVKGYVADHRDGWDARHAKVWIASVESDVLPVLGELQVDLIAVPHVLDVLKPIWSAKPETASRIRGRVEAVLSWAMAHGYRPQGPNPAAWADNLDHILPAVKKLKRPKEERTHPALSIEAMPLFMAKLRAHQGVAARALELLILSGLHVGALLGARRSEFDVDAKAWTVPGARMKNGKEFRLPVSERVVEILGELPVVDDGGYLFPGKVAGGHLSRQKILDLLRELLAGEAYETDGRGRAITLHGFRSSLRTWASETTSFPRDICEMALQHDVRGDVEGRYSRGDLFSKRAKLMQAWSRFCFSASVQDSVVPLRKRAAKAA